MSDPLEWDIEELVALAPAIFDARVKLGFRPVTWETLPVRLMCVIGELDELEEELEVVNPDGVNIELADVAMYLLTITLDLWPARWGRRHLRTFPPRDVRTPYAAAETLTKPTRRQTVNAFEAWRQGRSKDAGIFTELALLEVMRLAETLDVHLPAAIGAKLIILRERAETDYAKHPSS